MPTSGSARGSHSASRGRRPIRGLALATTVALAAAVVGVGSAAPAAAPAAGVDPANVELTLGPGASATVAKRITTPAVAPTPDIVFLADTTGSMLPVLANVRNNANTIMDTVREAQPDAQFAVADYKEERNGSQVFRVHTPLTPDTAAVADGMQRWIDTAGGGGDPDTDFINAHHRIATDAIAFRPNSTRITAWFGDARSHDPSLGHTLADTNAALQAARVRVAAVPVSGTPGGGLDAFGQATSITTATGGVLMPDTEADGVAQAILDGIHNLNVTVTPQVGNCAPQLTVGFDPANRTVRSGADALFNETIGVRPDAAAGTYQCTVDFLVNGVSEGFVQTITVHVPGLSIGDVQVVEGNSGTTAATLTVGLDRPATTPVTVHWATADGTATAPGDYTGGSGDLTFAPGETSRQVTIPVIGDTVDEPDETFTVTLSAPAGAAITDGSGVVTIVDDDGGPPPTQLSIGDVTVTEGNVGTVPATFTVTLNQVAAGPVTVQYATADGTATAPGDYTAGTGEVTFAQGETSKPVEVQVVGDTLDEQDETFTVTLTNANGAIIADDAGVGTIIDDDDPPPPPDLSIGDVTVIEGNAGNAAPVLATFTVSLNQAAAGPVTVRYATADGTATAPGDYTARTGEVTFAPGQVSQPVNVEVVGDTVDEQNESFTVTLANPVNATIGDDSGVGTIVDDDTGDPPPPNPVLGIGDVTVTEGNAGTRQASFTVTLDRQVDIPVSVHYATADGTATAPGDYTAVSDDIGFPAGLTSREVTVPILGDTLDEQDESFTVTLSNPTGGATIGDGTGVGTIVDDDGPTVLPELSIGDVSAVEGTGGTTLATFSVTLSEAATAPVTVQWATVDGTATSPDDFAGGGATLTFAPGQTSAQLDIQLAGDSLIEGDETFTVVLSNPSGATIGDGTGVGTIIDDDAEIPALSIGDATVTEGGTTPATFTVTLNQPSSSAVTVQWATVDGTATSPEDFAGGSGDLTFAPGETSRQFTVMVVDDTLDEPDETFTVVLSNPSGATIGDGTGVGTIIDDDPPPTRTLGIGDATVTEGDAGTGPAAFTVALDQAATTPVTVHWATADGTATSPDDFIAAGGDVSFAAGEGSKVVEVQIVADVLDEPDETFTVVLSNPTGDATIGAGTGVGTILDDDPSGRGVFSCTASALTLLSTRSAVANPANLPCRDDVKTTPLARLGLGLLSVRADGLTATTDQTPNDLSGAPAAGDNATSTAELASTRISTLGLTIEIGMIRSTAVARCVAGPTGLVPAFTGSSTITALKINGLTVPVGSGPVTIPLLVGSLKLNSTVTTASSVTQRAFELDTLLGDVIIGESRAGVGGTAANPGGNPCRS